MKAFRITSKDQYVQDINLNRGTYTFHAWVFAMGSNYSIGLKTQAGTWLNFNMADQIKAQEWRKVKITFTIYEPCVQFSLMNTFASEAAYVIVVAPMLEEGTNAGTQKPNELDLDESIGEGNVQVLLSNEAHVFAGTEDYAIPTTLEVYIHAFKGSTPVSLSVDDITIGALPLGLTAQKYADRVVFTVGSTPPLMVSPSGEVPITVTIDGKDYVRNFSYAISFKGADGTAKDIRLEASTQIMRKMKDGTWNPSTPVTVTATAINTTISKWEYSVNGGTFSTTPPIGVTRSGDVVSINPNAVVAYALYTIRASDGTISDTLSVIRLEDGADGDSAVTLLLSNESHTFAGSATAALAGSVNTTILAFKGTQQITPTFVTVNTSDLPTGMSRAINGSVVTFTVTTSMTSSSGVIPITVVVDGKTFVLQFSYSIAFKGTDGLSKGIYLNAAIQVIKYNAAGTPTPATNFTVVGTAVNTTISTWEYSVNGGSFSSTVPAGVSRSGNTVTISPTTVTFNTLSIRASDGTISDTITIAAVRDGDKGDDGADGLSKGIYLNAATQVIKYNAAGTPTPATNFTVVGTAVNTTISTWEYSVNGGSFSSTVPAGVSRSGSTVTISPTTITFNTLSIRASDGTISDTITIAAMRDGTNGLPGKLPIMMEWIQGDTHYNNDTVVSYVYYRAGNTWWRLKDAYTEMVATASPSTTYYQQLSSVEYLVTKVIIAEQGNLAGLIFKDNKLISQKGMINGVESTDYANPAFVPNVYIDGTTGEIVANKLLNPFVVADPDITNDLQTKLTNNHNIYLEAGGPVSYGWKQHVLPGTGTLADKRLDGLNIKIYAPSGGGNHRIKIVPAGSGMIYGDVPGHVVPSLKLVMNTRDTIHLSAVWNRVYEVLDWVVTSRTSYRIIINQGDASEIRVPNVFKEGDIIAKGDVSTAATFSNLLNRYDSTITCSVNSGRFTLSIPRNQYFTSTGVALNRAMSADQFDLQVTPNTSSHRTTYIYKRYGTANGITGVHFDIEFRTYNGSAPTATPFKFVLRALDYVFNNIYLDDEL